MISWLKVGRIVGSGPTISDDTLTIPVCDYNQNYSYPDSLYVTNIDGLSPVEADISSTDIANSDGTWFNLARCGSRNIVITMKLGSVYLGAENSMSKNRALVYKHFPVKKPVRLWLNTDLRYVYIDGYVESVQADYFGDMEGIQVSIQAPEPYFYNAQISSYSFTFGAFPSENVSNSAFMFPDEPFTSYVGSNGEVMASDFACGFDSDEYGVIKMQKNTDIDCPIKLTIQDLSTKDHEASVTLTMYDETALRNSLILDEILCKKVLPTGVDGWLSNTVIDSKNKTVNYMEGIVKHNLFGGISNTYKDNIKTNVDNSRFVFSDWLEVKDSYINKLKIKFTKESDSSEYTYNSDEFNSVRFTITPYIRYGGI